jgi:hypothetical protein
MSFQQNVKLLKHYLRLHGWKYKNTDELFEYFENHLNIEFKLPLIKADIDYPKMFEISLKKLKKTSPEISNLPLFNVLISQCKNMRQKYSKVKSEWILSEPNCKYNLGEIPDIYIPKNYIFESLE